MSPMRLGGGPIDLPLFSSIIDSCPDGVLAVGDDGAIRLINSTAEIIFGWGRRDVIGHTIDDLVPADARDQHAGHFAAYLASPEPRPMNAGRVVPGRHRDGRTLRLQVALSPVHSDRDIHVIAWVRQVRPGVRHPEPFAPTIP